MAHSIDPAAGAVRGFVPARNDEERYLMRHIEDLADAAFSRGIARYSAFLSDREQDLARAALGRAGVRDGWRFDGGWPEAERRVLCLEPEYSYGECPVRCVQLQCRALPGAALPAHKDYLGSLMGLALKREALGDILLPADAPGTAYAFALEPAAKLICRELCQAGRTEVSTRLLEPEEIPAFPAASFTASRSLSVQLQNSTKSKPSSFAAWKRSRKGSSLYSGSMQAHLENFIGVLRFEFVHLFLCVLMHTLWHVLFHLSTKFPDPFQYRHGEQIHRVFFVEKPKPADLTSA